MTSRSPFIVLLTWPGYMCCAPDFEEPDIPPSPTRPVIAVEGATCRIETQHVARKHMALLASGKAPPLPKDAWGTLMRVTTEQGRVVIRSAGPDRTWETEDDFVAISAWPDRTLTDVDVIF